jgi:hypothetical protein
VAPRTLQLTLNISTLIEKVVPITVMPVLAAALQVQAILEQEHQGQIITEADLQLMVAQGQVQGPIALVRVAQVAPISCLQASRYMARSMRAF